MLWLVLFVLVLLITGGGMKMLRARLRVMDHPIGGLFCGPRVEIQQPDLQLP